MNNPDPLQQAALLMEVHRFADATRLLRQHLATHPDDQPAQLLLARTLLQLDDLAAAAGCVERVLAADPDSVPALVLAGAVYSGQHRLSRARQVANAAIQLAPDDPAGFRIAVSIDLDADRVSEKTLTYALRVIELEPAGPFGYQLAGSTLTALRRRPEAGEYFRRASALDPTDLSITADLGRWHALSGRKAAAAQDFAQVIRADPTDDVALKNLQAVVWRTFWVAQLVLWVTTVVLSRIRLLSGSDPTKWVHVVGPIAAGLALIAWAYQLRGNGRGARAMLAVVRFDRTLRVGLIAHCLCLLAFVLTLFPGALGLAALIVGIGLLLISSGSVWVRSRQLARAQQQ